MNILLSKHKKLMFTVLHIAVWALFIRLTIPRIMVERSVNDIFFPLIIAMEYSLLIVYFYLNGSVFVPRLLSKKKTALFLAITIAAFILFGFAVPWLVRQYFVHFMSEPPFRPDMPPRRPHFPPPDGDRFSPHIIVERIGIYARSIRFLIVFVVSTGLKTVSLWYAEKQRLQELENSMVQAELSFLKSQIHPHFLFNSLNSIYCLALSKDDKAPEAILSLSDFLRFVTVESNHSRIPLGREMKMLKEYIRLQSFRASEKFNLQFQANGDFGKWEIMPLTFIPFVENAFKYGISAHIECFIHIGVEVKNGVLQFTCDNSVVLEINKRNLSEGVGLENIRKRLCLAYPEQHSLNIDSDSSAFHVELQISLV
ncbi:MAG: sensor histidine kinase [Dysgonamonadaceae bacterium]|jgi:hypothetical protein|nr:sensor histidine kinase [Dysgonamonadaceae bacterium]